jgi:Ankyrin repeats (3 copies)
LVKLHKILSSHSFTDDDIESELYDSALQGRVDACRLLWARLGAKAKQKCFAESISDTRRLQWHTAMRTCSSYMVQLFTEEFNFIVNQTCLGNIPLYYAIRNEDTCRLLLEHGADLNREVGHQCPLFFAVYYNNTPVARLLLQHGADPNLNHRPSFHEEASTEPYLHRCTDLAIQNRSMEILSLLLQHGAFVDAFNSNKSLHRLFQLSHSYADRETKVAICRLLAQHAEGGDRGTAAFMQASFEFAVQQFDIYGCQILLEAGIEATTSTLYRTFNSAVRAKNMAVYRILMQEYHLDPFLQMEENVGDCSPLVEAARKFDTTNTSLFQYFLQVWDERFSSTGGKNVKGNHPLHVVCCDSQVSPEAIQLLVSRNAGAVSTVDGEQGLLPFHFAAFCGASLNVLFFLLQHCPDALWSHNGGNAAALMLLIWPLLLFILVLLVFPLSVQVGRPMATSKPAVTMTTNDLAQQKPNRMNFDDSLYSGKAMTSWELSGK